MDFKWKLNRVWAGYTLSICGAMQRFYNDKACEVCQEFAKIQHVDVKDDCPNFNTIIEPPKGKGYQLWEDVSEGSPISPVFKTLDELCAWAEKNATTFASFKATKEEWKKMLSDEFVYHKEGNTMFI